jgi:hypothetical protein
MFVSKEPVPVTVDGENIIYIRPRMSYGVKQRVISAAAHVATDLSAVVDVGAYNLALLTENVVRWEGPMFAGHPCTPAEMEQLDPGDPLLDAVLAEINTRNTEKETTDPNGSAPSGSDGSTPSKSKLKAL